MPKFTRALVLMAAFVAGTLFASSEWPRSIARNVLLTRAYAQVVTGVIRGGGHGGVVVEKYRFRTEGGNRQRIRIERELVRHPRHHGEVFAVTQDNSKTTLWLKDEHGVVRNLIINKPGALVVVDPGK